MKLKIKIRPAHTIIFTCLFLLWLLCALPAAFSNAAQHDDSVPTRTAVFLKDGNVITGEILKNKNGSLIIDNVFQVLTIPPDKIERVEKIDNAGLPFDLKSGTKPEPAATASVFLKGTPPERLFNLGSSRPAPIESLVEKYEDGVVQI
ncbi:MAG TPA: hypothetical protein PK467_13280, partial [Candidatus Wallbacteria bacterium]|nr:hypothetical protein [Candidatus Wallbacteria bacterium]